MGMRIKQFDVRLDSNKQPILLVKNRNVKIDKRMNSVDKVYNTINEIYDIPSLAEEHVWVFALGNSLSVKGFFEVSKGASNQTLFPIREIMRDLLLCDASGFITAHNHPDNQLMPSDSDISSFNRIKQAAETCGIQCHDNIIVTDTTYYSVTRERLTQSM